jgi:uncharacterized protein
VAKILITGASGLIGKRLTEMLLEKGHEVRHLGRNKNQGAIKSFQWDINKSFIEKGALENVDTIIHLAGAGIADKRWTDERKREIVESRTLSTRLLNEELKKGNHKVSSFISASAIGFYGFSDSKNLLSEEDSPGKDFLAQVVKKWEDEVNKIAALNIRLVKIRIGIVLSKEGGVLAEIAKPVRFYVGAPLGTGKQNLSWIHIDDLCALFVKAVEDISFSGTYNGVGPYPVTNMELTLAIAKTMGRPVLLPPIPSFVLRLVFGEMANLVLYGSKVSAEKLRSTGFKYQFNNLEAAIENLLEHKNQ